MDVTRTKLVDAEGETATRAEFQKLRRPARDAKAQVALICAPVLSQNCKAPPAYSTPPNGPFLVCLTVFLRIIT